ncbi:MAG: DMT family transporter [Actinomycetota bacterium]
MKTPRAFIVLGVAGAVLVGILTATQSRINSELSLSIHDGYLAAVISFGSGFVIMLVALAVWRPGRRGLATLVGSVRARQTPWWYLIGGAAGGLFVLSQGLTGAVLGVALFTIAVVCGQTLSGLLVDGRGIGPVGPKPVTVTRVAGSVLALVAVGWAVSAQLVSDVPPWLLLLPFVAGLFISGQQAVNGQVRRISGSAMTATLLNFLVGTLVLVAAGLVHESIVGLPAHLPANPLLYLGGLVGTLFIALSTVVVRTTGVLLLGLGSVAGQLVTSLVLDLTLPVDGRVVAWTTVAGTLLTLVAVAIAAIPSRAVRAPV